MRYRTARRLVWIAFALCLTALALGVMQEALNRTDDTVEANARRVREGMTLAEVRTLLGTREERLGPVDGWPHGREERLEQVRFRGPEGRVFVHLDQGGRVVNARFYRSTSPRPGLLERLRKALGW
jgi:hypothetical protein